MSTLFTVNKSWHDSYWLFERLLFASSGDTILLLEDGVLAVHSAATLASFLGKCHANNVCVCVLESDLLLRGLDNKYPRIKEVDYDGFVDLVVNHDKQVAW